MQDIPAAWDEDQILSVFHPDERPSIEVKSLAADVYGGGPDDSNIRNTVTFTFPADRRAPIPPRLAPHINYQPPIDSDFHGFTPLSSPEEPDFEQVILSVRSA